jgi:hypothetical protein
VTTDAARSLPSLRTDSVNRGFCISLFTLEIVVLASAFLFFFFSWSYSACAESILKGA